MFQLGGLNNALYDFAGSESVIGQFLVTVLANSDFIGSGQRLYAC